MTRIRSAILLVAGAALVCALARHAPGQETPAAKDEVIDALDARVTPFFESISQGATQQAFDNLLRGSPLLIKKTEALQALIEKTNQIPGRFGRYRSYERIDARRVGKDLVLMRYLYKCEDFPVVWHFTFYRPTPRADMPAEETAWRAIAVRFDTELEALRQ